eukprot:6823428-Prymnesium_polylepis.1
MAWRVSILYSISNVAALIAGRQLGWHMRTRPTVGVPSVPWRAQQRIWCGSVIWYDRATAGSVAASS